MTALLIPGTRRDAGYPVLHIVCRKHPRAHAQWASSLPLADRLASKHEHPGTRDRRETRVENALVSLIVMTRRRSPPKSCGDHQGHNCWRLVGKKMVCKARHMCCCRIIRMCVVCCLEIGKLSGLRKWLPRGDPMQTPSVVNRRSSPK